MPTLGSQGPEWSRKAAQIDETRLEKQRIFKTQDESSTSIYSIQETFTCPLLGPILG